MKSLFEALYGYRPRFYGGELRQLSQTANTWTNPAEQQDQTRRVILVKQPNMKVDHDKRHYEGMKFDVSEVVVMKGQPRAGEPSKL